MKIHKKISLKNYHTFGIEVKANRLIIIEDEIELHECLSEFSPKKDLILGDGSNVLFTKDFEGTILKLETKGIQKVRQKDDKVQIAVKAGENWDEFVQYCLQNGYYGLENLAYIPGKVGSSPVQNIGAYGAEVKDFIVQIHAISVSDGQKRIFEKEECEFSYRSSVFKTKYRKEFIIYEVVFELSTNPKPNISYPDVAKAIQETGVEKINPQIVYETVVNIRKSKLPDHRQLGNAGSFFKNPFVSVRQAEELKKKIGSDLRMFSVRENLVKLSAAQLIEKSGWKGKQVGQVGVDKNQALILVNYGGASGQEVLETANKIRKDVYKQFGIGIEIEVNLI